MGEMAKYAIKVAIAVLTGTALLTALLTIISVVANSFNSIGALSEAFRIICVFLPFYPVAVLNTLSICVSALLAFITARKVYEVMTNFAQSTD